MRHQLWSRQSCRERIESNNPHARRGPRAGAAGVLVALPLLWAASVAASPDPANSTCPSIVPIGPSGTSSFDITIRDAAHIPIANCLVNIGFGGCGVSFSPSQPPGTTVSGDTAHALTNGSGQAHIAIRGWMASQQCQVSISANDGGGNVPLCSALAKNDNEGAYSSTASLCTHTSSPHLTLGAMPADGCDPGTAPTDFNGTIYQRVIAQGIDVDGHYVAHLTILAFNMEGTHPSLGHLTIYLDPSRPGLSADLRSVNAGSPFPLIHTTRMNIRAVADGLPGVTLQNHGPPLEFISGPSSSWPPQVTTYTLPVAVPFERVDSPGTIVMTACPGSVIVSGHLTQYVPQISPYGLVILAALLSLLALWFLRRRVLV